MTSLTDGQIDRLVKARWRSIGISQNDLAEALGAVDIETNPDEDGTDKQRPSRVADALDITADPAWFPNDGDAHGLSLLQSLLGLRLLRAFRELENSDTRRALVLLAEQIVRKQAGRGKAG